MITKNWTKEKRDSKLNFYNKEDIIAKEKRYNVIVARFKIF
ncbi:MAG: hypothetical protein Q7R89_02250 [bacterium]|nr:hypothetical protein [bacterium]